ncbi:hypothetical protein CGGC5_v010851 [Colletotrichum fructicola Nara gc5]|uniref:Uncharacterized protein n=1 Tax=Colletotrichum fructicola (strain Nara gc5) TaxID=1213859 RepID=A0A7J6IVJ4_COLFN|nr:hypothetical protein CGGC5_v010851 [Colletotrichum fructicola Nara gc5]
MSVVHDFFLCPSMDPPGPAHLGSAIRFLTAASAFLPLASLNSRDNKSPCAQLLELLASLRLVRTDSDRKWCAGSDVRTWSCSRSLPTALSFK